MDEKVQKLCDLIVRAVHPKRVVLFGSRARGDAEERSDIDLAVESDSQDIKAWQRLLGELENQTITLLPVDVVRWEEATPALRQRIEKEGTPLYDREKVAR